MLHLIDISSQPMQYPRQMPSIPARGEIPASNLRFPEYLVKLCRRCPATLVSCPLLCLPWARSFACVLAVISIVSLVSSCTLQRTRPATTVAASSAVQDDSQILQAEQSHAINIEVTGKATVKRILQDDNEPPRHERFVIELSNGATVLVAHNIDEAGKVPVVIGSRVIIHGVYIWKESGGVIHWTHHSNSPRHEGGWIECDGKRYQ